MCIRDRNNKAVTPFEFTEVQAWSDSVALVRKNQQWLFFDIFSRRFLPQQMRDIRFIRNTDEERLAIVRGGDLYGVISNRKGTIIPINFSDIVNVGSPEEPLYFTEKHVEEALLFVVIYYDKNGRMLRKEVYEQDDYEKIYCN